MSDDNTARDTLSGSAYDRLIEALEVAGQTVNANGDAAAMAQCPAHNDNRPSLKVTKSPGSVLLHCYAGCDTRDVLAALSLGEKDLFNKSGGVEFRFSGGRIVTRTPDKKFSQRGNTKDDSLFQVEDIGSVKTVYVTEGEKDALNLATLCDVAAVSPPMGANSSADKWNWTPLAGRHVIIVADRDASGAGRLHADDVAAQLRPIAKSVRIMESAVGKDVSDHIAAGKTLDELVERSLLADLSFTSEWLEAQEFPDLEEIVPGIIVEGVTVLAGPPKLGKSFLVGDLATAVVSGGKALGYIAVEKRPVLVLALEDGHRRLQSRYRDIFGGAIPPGITFITKATPGECISVIAEYLDRYGDEKPLIILDTLGKAKEQKQSGQESYLIDYELGGKFKALADSRPGSAILIIHHTRKADAADFVDLVSGTHGIAGSVDSVVTLSRKRGEAEATMNVTGRDVVEGEYALIVEDGILWRLDGTSLPAAADRVDAKREAAEQDRRIKKLGPDMRAVLKLVNERGHVTSENIAVKCKLTPNRVGQITTRLVDGDYIARAGRGEFHSLSYAAAHPSLSNGGSGVSETSGLSAVDTKNTVPSGNMPLTPDTPATTDTPLTTDRPRNTCRCGAPLTLPRSRESGMCTECRADQT